MKNYQYLTSGILEAHLLGLATEKEQEELKHLLATDADVLNQLAELETEMESYFLKNSVPPPPQIREKIELRISETEIKKWEEPIREEFTQKSTESRSNEPHYVNVEVNNTHIQVHKHWKTAFIAVFILSKVFLILGLYYYFKADSLAQEVERLKAATHQSVPLGR